MDDLISRQAAIDTIVDKGAIGDSEVKCLFCGHHIAERPFEVYCNIMCKWVIEKDYCTMFETRTGEDEKNGGANMSRKHYKGENHETD